jgi:hypothetical protein
LTPLGIAEFDSRFDRTIGWIYFHPAGKDLVLAVARLAVAGVAGCFVTELPCFDHAVLLCYSLQVTVRIRQQGSFLARSYLECFHHNSLVVSKRVIGVPSILSLEERNACRVLPNARHKSDTTIHYLDLIQQLHQIGWQSQVHNH